MTRCCEHGTHTCWETAVTRQLKHVSRGPAVRRSWSSWWTASSSPPWWCFVPPAPLQAALPSPWPHSFHAQFPDALASGLALFVSAPSMAAPAPPGKGGRGSRVVGVVAGICSIGTCSTRISSGLGHRNRRYKCTYTHIHI